MKAIIGPDGRVGDFLEDWWDVDLAEGLRLADCPPGFAPEHDPWDYLWDGGALTYVEPDPEPPSPAEVIKAIFTASPALTVGLVDSLAARMADYLPEWDAGTTYTLGCLAVKDGKVQRRTVGGAWREVRE